MTERYLCVHGHFYQPPRENPWLEVIELQDSAYPYHDWNERITAECYGPNARSRILDEESRIVRIVNNYSRISFNFGPTLLKWLADEEPSIYHAILEADEQSIQRFSGHGSAIAQPYNHMILPLATSRDKQSQVLWGMRDFEYRFGRRPAGMWLPEAAVDIETLETLARAGILFTILSPYQAARVREVGGRTWKDVSGGQVDPSRAYIQHLPSGMKISIFFYDAPISQAVAFEGILDSGAAFADRLVSGFSQQRTWPQLLHIATDGESYGHHHRFGDMALAYALDHIDNAEPATLTNYAEFLARYPATHQVEITEATSWSCAHGVERWRSDCGCNTGSHPGWKQSWRAPLREALDWLRDKTAPYYEELGRSLLKDPWVARDAYIDVILNRRGNESAFFAAHAAHQLRKSEVTTALKLLELQRHALLMYTSCGWFFDDISGIETVQVIQYAGRVIQLARELFGRDFEPEFLDRLEQAESNVPENRNGRAIYETMVRPAVVGLAEVAAHFAVSSLFERYGKEERVYCYTAETEDYRTSQAGVARLAAGSVRMTSEITLESQLLAFGVVHLGDHNLAAGVREFPGPEQYEKAVTALNEAFSRADLPEVIRIIDHQFEGSTYSFKSLFRDEQRKILGMILESTVAEAESTYRQVHEHHAPLMRFLRDISYPLPQAFQAAAEIALTANLRRDFADENLDPERVRGAIEEARLWSVNVGEPGLAYIFEKTLKRASAAFWREPERMERLQVLENLVGLLHFLPFHVGLWEVQNDYYHVLVEHYPDIREIASRGDEQARAWIRRFLPLGAALGLRVE